ncbi:hypothetical protein OsJ_29563 [Oryza sativa Japonica Group]|uniref:Uncharacterized protein n=1 Tax=Oryza sativa subsp. japonica TaxID=39947 RepID=A3BZD3_ORYSJ|nr:hypothetical protein OsJ_29563 [Oryza sativa Japonica Group]
MDHSEQSVHAAAHDMALIERHQPWEMLDGMALSIIDDAGHGDAAAAGGGVLAILDMIVARLGAAIGLEEALLAMARTSSYEGPKVDEILRVRNALDEIRSEMDLPALMRRLLHKRRGVTEITTCRPAAGAGAAATEQDQADETERLMKKMRLKC